MDTNPIEEQLERIETGIRQLKTQYDMYFAGSLPRQPFEVRKELERLIDGVGKMKMQRFSDRFRFNGLSTRYQTMTELWNKMIRAKEEGRLKPGIPGFVEPVRKPAAAAPPPPARERNNGRHRGKPSEAGIFYSSTVTRTSPEDGAMKAIYQKYMEARAKNGVEGSGALSYNRFAKQLAAQTEAIKKKTGSGSVTFSIVVKEDGIKLRAAAGKKGGAKG